MKINKKIKTNFKKVHKFLTQKEKRTMNYQNYYQKFYFIIVKNY